MDWEAYAKLTLDFKDISTKLHTGLLPNKGHAKKWRLSGNGASYGANDQHEWGKKWAHNHIRNQTLDAPATS